MSKKVLKIEDGFFVTTLSQDITAVTQTIPLTAVPTASEGYIVIEPLSATKREVCYYTSAGSESVTTADDPYDSNDASGRGCTDSIATGANTTHTQGVQVIIANTRQYLERWYDNYAAEHNVTDGTHNTDYVVTLTAEQTVTNKTLTSPTINNPTTKSTTQVVAAVNATVGGTTTLDLSAASIQNITMGAGNTTIALSNVTTNQPFIISITQPDPGSRTVTWFSTIKWAGGSAPTLTTTANKRDTFGFICTGADTYDGYVVGQNI